MFTKINGSRPSTESDRSRLSLAAHETDQSASSGIGILTVSTDPASTVPSYSVLSVPSMLLTTVKAAPTVDSVLSSNTVTT